MGLYFYLIRFAAAGVHLSPAAAKAQRGGRNRHARAGFAGTKEARQQGQKRLGAIDLQEGTHAAESDSRRGPWAGRQALRWCVELHASG